MFRSPVRRLPLFVTLAASPLFAQVPTAAGAGGAAVADPGSDAGSALRWGDYDCDGLDDALVITAEGRLTMLRNAGDGSLEDATIPAGLDAVEHAAFALWRDYDGDGYLDLFVGTQSGPSCLLRNHAGVFVDVTVQSGITVRGADRFAHWVDYDGDGRLDLHLVNAAQNALYHALPAGGFEAVLLPAPGAGASAGTGPAAAGGPAGAVEATGAAERGAPALEEDAEGVRPALDVDADGGPGRRRQPAAGPGGGPGFNAAQVPGAPTSTAAPAGPLSNYLRCVDSLQDVMGGGCIEASTSATLGMLYPLSSKLFVDEGTGNVGLGTTSPQDRLDVAGDVRVNGTRVIEGTQWVGIPAQWSTGNFRVTATSTVGGGKDNQAQATASTVAGGENNFAAGSHAFAGGGFSNNAGGIAAVVGGGESNIAVGSHATIGGGFGSLALGMAATVGGGNGNSANTEGATVSGGVNCAALAPFATVPGGKDSGALGDYSLAAGRGAVADHDGSFVWGDSSAVAKHSSKADEFNVYAEGGVRMFAEGASLPSLVVDDAGRIGVGVDAPQRPVELVTPPESYGFSHRDDTVELVTFIADGSACPQGAHIGTITNHPLSFVTNNTCGKMLLDQDGKLGVGTDTPLARLHVRNGSTGATPNSNADLIVEGTAGFATWINVLGDVGEEVGLLLGHANSSSDGAVIWNDFNDHLQLRAGGATQVVVEGNGNVGIGTLSPTFKLEVNGSAAKPGGGSWSVSSDRRLKKNVHDLEGALDTLLALRGVTFEYKDPAAIGELAGERVGFIAQEVEEVLPDWVEEVAGYKRLTVRGFEALAVESLRELSDRNAALEARNAALEARVVELETLQAELGALRASLAALNERVDRR